MIKAAFDGYFAYYWIPYLAVSFALFVVGVTYAYLRPAKVAEDRILAQTACFVGLLLSIGQIEGMAASLSFALGWAWWSLAAALTAIGLACALHLASQNKPPIRSLMAVTFMISSTVSAVSALVGTYPGAA